MLVGYLQRLDPLHDKIFWSPIWSTVLAGLPVLVLFWLLVPRRWLAPKAGAAGAVTAILVAIIVYGMPVDQALWSFAAGAGFGLLPVGWTIFCAMLLYNITVETGQFTIVRRSVASISGDARIQAILIGFSFGAFLEGAAGGGTPVAICGAIMVGLGFHPFTSAVLCLIANTSPVAYGGLGTPIIVLSGVTGISSERISTMAGHQLPILSFIVPLWMVKCMCSWRQTLAVWPALVVAGGSFSVFQFTFATIHEYVPGVVLYPMTDIGGGIFSLVVTAMFLNFWKPAKEWHFDKARGVTPPPDAAPAECADPHASKAAALLAADATASPHESKPLTFGNVTLAWMPYILMSVFLMLTGLVRQKEVPVKEGPGPIQIVPGLHTNYQLAVPTLHNRCSRDPRLHPIKIEETAALVLAGSRPLEAAVNAAVAMELSPKPESALFNVAWLTAPGTAVFFASLASMVMLRMSLRQIRRVFARTFFQMKIPVPTIAFMLGLSYVTRYAGMDATLGFAFAKTGVFYPFFAALLGWLGVFLTGTDAGSNALFGSLQKITATEIYNSSAAPFSHLGLDQAQVLICTANSTGGVMGKMIDAQSICVATAATHQLGREADIFKAVFWHSIILAAIVGAMTLLQAYVHPFTQMVPGGR
jgi:lactate permease